MIGNVKGKKILDIGCGNGKYTNQMKERGASRVVGVDVSSGMLYRIYKNII